MDNAIQGNSIFGTWGLGIDLGADGVTPDTPGGPHTGPNDLQNYPVLTAAEAGSTEVKGTLNAAGDTTFTIDFYANDHSRGSAQSNGQGQYYLGSTTVTTDNTGNASFDDSNLAATTHGEWISATATDPNGNTSEFSLDIPATVPSSIVLTASSDSQTYGTAVVTATVTGPNPADGTPNEQCNSSSTARPLAVSPRTLRGVPYSRLALLPLGPTRSQQSTRETPRFSRVRQRAWLYRSRPHL